MNPIDIDAIARQADPCYAGNQQSAFDSSCLPRFAALVLEKAAYQFELQPHVEMFRPSVAEELRAMAEALQSGERG